MLDSTIRTPNCCVFLGAGASIGTGLPLGDAGAARIVQALFELSGRRDLWNLATQASLPPWPRFEVVLGSLARYDRDAPRSVVSTFALGGISSTHRLLAATLATPTLWLTTNFDDQIERALAERGREFVSVSDRDQIASECSRRDVHVVVKLHGDGRTKDAEWHLGARIDQILRAFPASATASLTDVVAGRPLLVVGYAARDPDLELLIRSITKEASQVAWVGYGSPEPVVSQLLSAREAMHYYGDGAPTALEDALGEKAPPSSDSPSWPQALTAALRSLEPASLIQAVADLSVTRGDPVARGCVPALHELVDQSNRLHRAHVLRRSIELSLRDGVPVETVDQQHVRPLLALARSSAASTEARIEAYSALGMHLFSTGSATELEELLLEARPVVDRGTAFDQVRHLQRLGIARAYQGADRLASALDDIRNSVNRARAQRFPVLEMEGNNHLGVVLMRAGRANEAEAALVETKAVIDEIGDPRKDLVYRVNLAEAIRLQGRFSKAADINEAAVAIARQLGDAEIVGNLTGNLGICRIYAGDIGGAERAFLESARVARRLRGEMWANALYNRGWLRALLSLWDDAAGVLGEAAEAYRAVGARGRAGGAEGLRGWCRLRLGDYAGSVQILRAIQSRGEVPTEVEFYEKYSLLRIGIDHPPGAVDARAALAEFRNMPEERVHYIDALVTTDAPSAGALAAEAWSDLSEIRLVPLTSSFAASCTQSGLSKIIPSGTPALESLVAELLATPTGRAV